MLMMAKKKKSGADLTDHRRFIMQQTSCVLARMYSDQPTQHTTLFTQLIGTKTEKQQENK